MKNIKFAKALLLLALLASNPPAFAQSAGLPTELPGRVSGPSVDSRDTRLTAAERQKLVEKVDGIFERLLSTDALASPRGFAINRGIILEHRRPTMPEWHPARASGTMLLRVINPAEGSSPDASGGYSGYGEGPTIRVSVNDLAAIYPYPEEGGEDRDKYFDFSLAPADFSGFPVLRFRSRTHLVIAKPGRAPFRAVTQQEILERELADHRAILARIGEADAPELVARGQQMEAELAALSPDERAAPACRNEGRGASVLAPCGENSSSTYVVTPDLNYFDRSAAKSDVQFIVISASEAGGVGHKLLEPITRAAVESLDLEELQSSLD